MTNSLEKILLVDTGFSSFPFFDYLNKHYDLWVCGNNPNDCLALNNSKYIYCDYSDVDQLYKIVTQNGFDKFIPGCNDISYKSCAQLNESLNYINIDSYDNFDILNYKFKYKNMLQSININTPSFFDCKNIYEYYLVKHKNLYSGKGISKLKFSEINLDHFENNDYFIEQFIEGDLYSASVFVENQKIVKYYFVKEGCFINPYVVDSSYLFSFSDEISQRIIDDLNKISNQLNLVDGLLHMQFILNGAEFYFIDACRRCPGDLYSLLIEYSTGENYCYNYIKGFIGDFSFEVHNAPRLTMRNTIIQNSELKLRAINFYFNSSSSIFYPLLNIGSQLMPSPNGRVGIMFNFYTNNKHLEFHFNKNSKFENYNIQGNEH